MLINADDDAQKLSSAELPDYDGAQAKLDGLNEDSSAEEFFDAYSDSIIVQSEQAELLELAADISVADYLESIEYGDGTLYDFFTRTTSEVTADITSLYPMVAALSEGQRAGVEFISLRELVMIGNRETEYSDKALEDLETTSVFEGVDRRIYQKGGVALTSDALRNRALARAQNRAERDWLTTKTIVIYAITGASLLGFLATIPFGVRVLNAKMKLNALTSAYNKAMKMNMTDMIKELKAKNYTESFDPQNMLTMKRYNAKMAMERQQDVVNGFSASTRAAAWMSVGFAAATFIMSGVSAYVSWRDMKDFYKVDYTPIPHFMVDEKSITYYNERGEKLVKQNQAAYYEAVTCNRSESAKTYKALGSCADLNGDVGQQWLALYACRDYEEMQPILADSFKVVVGSSDIPAGYDNTGIHMFGSDSAFNLNNKMYDWNQSAKSVFVYFKIDETAPLGGASTSGSAFSAGTAAIIGICGVGLGALVTAVCMTAVNKRKSKKATAAV